MAFLQGLLIVLSTSEVKTLKKEIKMKAIVMLTLLVITGVVSANGGLSLGTVEKHMAKPTLDKSTVVTIDAARLAHGPINYFQVGDNQAVIAETKDKSDDADSSI